MDEFMSEAIAEARLGLEEGGIPIGSVLVYDGKIIGRGHNRRVQEGSVIKHAEMDCLKTRGGGKQAYTRRARCILRFPRVTCAVAQYSCTASRRLL